MAAARAFAVQCYIQCGRAWKKATRLLRETWPRRYGKVPRHPSRFLQTWVKRYDTSHLYINRPGRGRTTPCSDLLVDTAAEYFKAGTWTYPPHKPKGEWHGYETMKEAVLDSPDIRRVLAKTGATQRTLWAHIIKRHPEIRQYARDYKAAYTAKHKAQRLEEGGKWLERAAAAGAAWGSQLVFFDEGCIQLVHATHRRRYEYAAQGDPRVRTVLHLPLPKGATGFEVHFFVAVHAVVGPLFIEFTTGTTDLLRRHRKEFPDPAGGFKVRGVFIYYISILIQWSRLEYTRTHGSAMIGIIKRMRFGMLLEKLGPTRLKAGLSNTHGPLGRAAALRIR